MASNGQITDVSLAPLNTGQRQRLECMTAVRGLWAKTYQYNNTGRVLEVDEILDLTDYLFQGRKP